VSTGIDVVVCDTPASGAQVSVSVSGSAVSCVGSDGTSGTLDVLHLALVDNSAQAVPFDYAQATGFWGLGFCFVVGLYFVTRGIGAVVEFIRRA
jgi:hypothetical protein